jgi:hypothetical protein
MNIETTLRETLHSRSAGVPERPGMLSAAEARASRLHRHRRVAGVGMVVVAAAVALVLVTPTVIAGMAGGRAGPPPAIAALTPTPSPALEAEPVSLVPAPDLVLPDFPFTPGWVPPGLAGPSREYTYADGDDVKSLFLRYQDPARRLVPLTVQLADHELILDSGQFHEDANIDEDGYGPRPDTKQSIVIQGVEAELLSSDTTAFLEWQHSDDLWVLVSGGPAQDVIRFADELVERPFPANLPFVFDLLPEDAWLDSSSPSWMWVLAGPDGPAEGFSSSRHSLFVQLLLRAPGTELCSGVGGSVDEASGDCLLPREPVQVGGRDGELVGESMVVVYLDEQVALTVELSPWSSLGREDLLRLAAGIELTPYARPRP